MPKTPVPKKKLAQELVLSRRRLPLKAKHRKSCKEEMFERRQMVMRYRLKGLTYNQIAKKLGVGAMTIRRDMQMIKQNMADKVTEFERDQALGECLNTYELIHQQAWDQYHKCKETSQQRVQFLNLIRAAENDRVKVLMDVGLIGREAAKVEHNVKADDTLKELTADAKNLIAMALLKSKLQPPLAPVRELSGGNGQSERPVIDIPPENVEVTSGGNGSE